MTERYARLRPNWFLRGWLGFEKALVNWTNAKLLRISNSVFYVAESCNGKTNFDSLAFLPEHRLILDRLVNSGIAELCHYGETIGQWQHYRFSDNPLLREILWCVTGLCNLQCRHCYMQAPSGHYGQPSFPEMKQLIDQFVQANVIQVSLTGGEPFIRKDFLDILAYLYQQKIWVTQIYTNGLLITKDALNEIKNVGLFPYFQVSYDGLGFHERMRGTKNIDAQVIKKIRMIRETGFPVIIASNFDKKSIDCIQETYTLLRSLDIQAWRLGTPLAIGNWHGQPDSLTLEEQASVYEPVLRRWISDGKPFEIVLGLFLRVQARGTSTDYNAQHAKLSLESYDCGSCRENPNLLPDGTLLPCPGYVDSPLKDHMPNLFSQDLSTIWKDSYLRSLIDLKKSDILAQNESCNYCEYFTQCGAGCRASALRETGNLMAKDPIACELWKKGMRQHFREVAELEQ